MEAFNTHHYSLLWTQMHSLSTLKHYKAELKSLSSVFPPFYFRFCLKTLSFIHQSMGGYRQLLFLANWELSNYIWSTEYSPLILFFFLLFLFKTRKPKWSHSPRTFRKKKKWRKKERKPAAVSRVFKFTICIWFNHQGKEGGLKKICKKGENLKWVKKKKGCAKRVKKMQPNVRLKATEIEVM